LGDHMKSSIAHAGAENQIPFMEAAAEVFPIQAQVNDVVLERGNARQVRIAQKELTSLIALLPLVGRRKETNPRLRRVEIGERNPNGFPQQDAAAGALRFTQI